MPLNQHRITVREMSILFGLGEVCGGLLSGLSATLILGHWGAAAVCAVAFAGALALALRLGDAVIERTYLEPGSDTEDDL